MHYSRLDFLSDVSFSFWMSSAHVCTHTHAHTHANKTLVFIWCHQIAATLNRKEVLGWKWKKKKR